MDEFCDYYNKKAVKDRQKSLLAAASISLDKFYDEYETKDGRAHKPLKFCSKSELVAEFGKIRSRYILRAQKVKVKGISTGRLICEQNVSDPTDVGKGENENTKSYTAKRVITYILTFVTLSAITVKNVTDWSWAEAGLLLVQVAFSIGSILMGHFKGYNDVTIALVSHYNRKSDILTQFYTWFAREGGNGNEKTE